MTLPGGNDVGTAYIRILADGGGFDESLRRQLKENNRVLEDQGKKDGKAYNEALNKERKKGFKVGPNSAVDRELQKQRAKFNAEGERLGGSLGDKIEKALRKHLGDEKNGDIAAQIRRNLTRAFNAGLLDEDGIKRQLTKNFVRLRAQAILDIERLARQSLDRTHTLALKENRQRQKDADEQARILRDLYARLARADFNYSKDHTRALKENARRDLDTLNRQTRSRDQSLRRDGDLQKKLFAEFEKLEKRRRSLLHDADIEENQREVRRRTKLINAAVIKGFSAGGERDFRDLDRLRAKMEQFNHAAEQGFVRSTGAIRRDVRELSDRERTAARLAQRIERIANIAGRSAGKGSRNNFFNALGSAIQGLVHVALGGIPKVLQLVGELGSEFAHAFNTGETALEKFKNIGDFTIKTLGKGLLSLAGAAGAGAALLGGLVVVGGLLLPLVVALVGAVVGLAGALSFALAGALGTLLPLILPVIAAVGTLAIAFAGLTKKGRDSLRAQLQPINDFFVKLRSSVRTNLFSQLGKDAKILGPVLNQSVIPLVSKVARALAGVGTSFSKVIAGPGFKKFLGAMQFFLPEAVTGLGNIFAKLFSGLTGLFRGLAPFALNFLHTIERLTTRFAIWANSAKGQNRIEKFMRDAGRAAFAAWVLIKDLFKVTGDLLSAGANAPRHGFLDSISDSLQRFDKFLNSGRGRKALRGFFEETVNVFRSLGHVVNGIASLFIALNSKAGQKILAGALAGLATIFKILGAAIPVFNATIGAMFRFLADHTGLVKALVLAFIGLKLAMLSIVGIRWLNAIIGPGGVLGTFARNLGLSAAAIRGIGAAMSAVAVIAAGAAIGSSIHRTGGGGWLESILGGAAAGAALGSILPGIGTVVGAVGGALASAIGHGITLWNDHKKAGKAAAAAEKAAVDSLTQALLSNNGVLDANLRKQITSGLQTSGKLDQAQSLINAGQGISGFNLQLSDFTDAALGSQAAIKKIKDAFDLFDSRPGLFNPATQSGKKLLKALKELEPALGQTNKQLTKAAKNAVQNATANHRLLSGFRTIAQQTKAVGGTDLEKDNAASVLNANFIRERIKLLADQAVAFGKHSHSISGATAAFKRNTQSLRDNLIAAGFSAPAIDRILAGYKKFPKEIVTRIKASVTDAVAKVKTMRTNLLSLKNRRILLTADVRAGVRESSKLGHQIQALKDKRIKIDTSTVEGRRKAAQIDREIQSLKNKRVRIDAAVDDARKRAASLDRLIQQIKNKAIEILVKAGVGQKTIDTLVASLNAVPTTKTVDIYVNQHGKNIAAAAGMILTSATMIRPNVIAGEAGAEAVVPLNRPLSQIDPSVRWMAALIRNGGESKFAAGGIAGGGRTNTFGDIIIQTPTTDPAAVAAQLVAKLVAQAY